MSSQSSLTIGIVAEGPTDHTVFSAILRRVVGDGIRVLPIQPEQSDAFGGFGEFGGGWKGVRKWCETTASEAGSVNQFLSSDYGPCVDLLCVHVDADVAADKEIRLKHPCPPASDTVTEMRKLVLRWLGEEHLPGNVVLVIPSKSTEAWIVAALRHKDGIASEELECHPKPERVLTVEPYDFMDKRRGGAKKDQGVYRDKLAPVVAAHWLGVCAACGEAKRFHDALINGTSSCPARSKVKGKPSNPQLREFLSE